MQFANSTSKFHCLMLHSTKLVDAGCFSLLLDNLLFTFVMFGGTTWKESIAVIVVS